MSTLPLLDTKEALPEPTSMGCVSLQTNGAVFFFPVLQNVFFLFFCATVIAFDRKTKREEGVTVGCTFSGLPFVPFHPRSHRVRLCSKIATSLLSSESTTCLIVFVSLAFTG